eukprot:SAG22_NODE_1631_length_3936_cov_2.342716_4_plen_97_part_00
MPAAALSVRAGFKAVSPAKAVGVLETRLRDGATGDVTVMWQDASHRFIQVYTGRAKDGLVAIGAARAPATYPIASCGGGCSRLWPVSSARIHAVID